MRQAGRGAVLNEADVADNLITFTTALQSLGLHAVPAIAGTALALRAYW